MGHSAFDLATRGRHRWNAGRVVGAKYTLKPQQAWAIRFWRDRERRPRDRALSDLATNSKLPGYDVVNIRTGEHVSGCQRRQGRGPSHECAEKDGPASRFQKQTFST